MSQTAVAEHSAWVRRWLGVNIAVPMDLPKPALPTGDKAAPRLSDRPAVALPLAKPVQAKTALQGNVSSFKDAGGRPLTVTTSVDGKIAFSAPPPPVTEITFAGGGGKGAALPGALRALQNVGQLGSTPSVMDGVTVVKGASVGSLTASLAACGMTGDGFAKLMRDPATAKRIMEEKGIMKAAVGGFLETCLGSQDPGTWGGWLTKKAEDAKFKGSGLQTVLRETMEDTLLLQIASFQNTHKDLDGAVSARLDEILKKIVDNKKLRDTPGYEQLAQTTEGVKGITFQELSDLAKIIPGIKPVEISGTMMRTKAGGVEVDDKDQPQLVMFSAETTPDVDISLAARASASLPPVFDRVEVPLGPGMSGIFQDGGVMNNSPASNTVRAQREVDPSPATGRMTFVFQDNTTAALKTGVVTAGPNAMNDFVTNSQMSARQYSNAADLAENPGDIVVVPLKFDRTDQDFGGWFSGADYTGLYGGTMNFTMPPAEQEKLQKRLESVTKEHIEALNLPREREFASVSQMLTCITLRDLEALAEAGYADPVTGLTAASFLQFRNDVTRLVEQLKIMHDSFNEGGRTGAPDDLLTHFVQNGDVSDLLKELQALAGGDPDKTGFVARELNRYTSLDPVLERVRAGAEKDLDVVRAGAAVADSLRVRSWTRQIAGDLIYPTLMKSDFAEDGKAFLKLCDAKFRQMRVGVELTDELRNMIEQFERHPGMGYLRAETVMVGPDDILTELVPDAEKTGKLVEVLKSYLNDAEKFLGGAH